MALAEAWGIARAMRGDDDFQRHDSDRHHREGSRQDRFGQQVDEGTSYVTERLRGGGTGSCSGLRSTKPGTRVDARYVSEAKTKRDPTRFGW